MNVWFHVSAPDNDSHMCGSDDALLPDVQNVPICSACGYKTSPFFINPEFRVRRRSYDLSFTFDGYAIASLKFREAVARSGLTGAGFEELPNDEEFVVFIPRAIVGFDAKRRNTRFEVLCSTCGLHSTVAGATPVFLKGTPPADLCRSDILFGSGNSRWPLVIASENAKDLIQRERLRGVEFELAVT